MQSAQPDRAFEVFVKRTLSTIQKESWGRSKECKELRERCQNVLNLLHDHEQGHLQYEGSLAVAVLEPLYLACASTNPKIVDAALGCLHKLVAHAWLQGESSSGGQASDGDVVSRVIRTVIRCGEASAAEGMQLAVIRALLTFATAEHFVAHGDCLLAAVRMIFNLALGAEDEVIKRTASNALLQMLNTITKRVTAPQLFGGSSASTSRRSSLDGSASLATQSLSQLASPLAGGGQAGSAAAGGGAGGGGERGGGPHAGRLAEEQQAVEEALAAAAAAAAARWVASGGNKTGAAGPSAMAESAGGSRLPSVALASLSNAQPAGLLSTSEGRPSADGRGGGGRSGTSALPQDGIGEAASTSAGDGSRTAQLATLAEQRDLAGLEAALGAATNLEEGLNASEEEGPVVGRVRRPARSSGDGAGGGGAAGAVCPTASSISSAGASLQSNGPSISLRTSSAALSPHHGYVPPSPAPPLPPMQASPGRRSGSGAMLPGLPPSPPPSKPGDSPFRSSDAGGISPMQPQHLSRTSHSQRQLGPHLSTVSSQHSGHHHHHHHHHHHSGGGGGHRGHGPRALRTSERDVLLVLTAFCRLASREGGVTEVDKYLAAGKLLALELVVKVLQNPIHCWDNVRDDFVRHLHQPLCLVLLRNCSPSDAASFALALRLLTAVLLQPKLRKGLKAELGAFYPLLLLRPLEVEQMGSPELASAASALPCLAGLCSEPQLLVDLFVNYDCDLKAPNLYERTVQALSRLSQRTELDGPPPPAGPKQQELAKQLTSARDAALRSLLSVVHCLDVWSAPLKEAGAEAGGLDKPGAAAGSNGQQKGTVEGDSESDSCAGSGAAAAGGGGGGALRANGGAAGASEAERFEAVKVAKSSLSRGLSMFNSGNPVKALRFLISSGVVEDSPAGAAVFLRAHASDLDPSAMGEYLGHHGDFELAAMHAYVDQERYGGMSIDGALRSFLLPFRLPGEAQKIDRLMEAFAERYVRDNPSVFRNADAAYVLAFAVIMLNTDAHNPLAERRLDRAGFVAMTSLPAEDGGAAAGGGATVYEPALPVRELEGIYDRIVAQEIVVRSTAPAGGGGAGGTAAGPGGRRGVAGAAGGRGGGGNKLAAALGLRALVAPFRSAGAADRKQVSNAERQRQQMMEVAEMAVARGGDAGGSGGSTCLSTAWHTCTHAAHARPMLTVSGEALTAALVAALPRVPDAEAVLGALVTLAQLAGLMGLEEQCESALAAVADAASVAAPAPHGTAAAARQLVALRALLGAASSSDAGQLGSAWTIILRAASGLEALVRTVTRPLQPGETGVTFMSPPSAAAGGGGGADGTARPPTSSGGAGGLLTKMFAGFWGGGGGGGGGSTGGAPAAKASNGSGPAARGKDAGAAAGRKDGAAGLPPPPVRVMPGAATVMWAVTDGRQVIEKVYTRSSSLDGEAVVVFVRALCAVSREELDATRPRVYSLQRLVEVAHLNLVGRIRLIWSKLWAVLSAHLVMAACHGQQAIAAQAVDALRALAGRVLEREQMQLQRATAAAGVGSRSGSNTAAGAAVGAAAGGALLQSAWGSSEGALRPFVAVLRLSDDSNVRAMALAAVAGIMTTHARSLGAGWRVAMEALRRAAEDGASAVYEQAVGALEVAVAALFRGVAAAPPPQPAAVQRTAAGAAAVAAASPPAPGHDCYRETLRAILTAIRNPHQPDRAPSVVQLLVLVGDQLAARPPQPQGQSGGNGGAASSGFPSSYSSQQHTHPQQWPAPAPPPLESAASGGVLVNQPSHRSLLDHLAAPPPHSRLPTPSEEWALLLEVVADVAATPAAPRLAAAGLEASLDLLRAHSTAWGARAWRVMLQRVVSAVAFRVPAALDPVAHPAEAAAATAAGLPLESISTSFVSRVDRLYPLMCSQLAPLAASAAAAAAAAPAGPRTQSFRGRHRRWSYDSEGDDDDDDDERVGGVGTGGTASGAAADLYRELLALLAETCLGWFRHPAEAVARVGLSSLSRLLDVTGGVVLQAPSATTADGGAAAASAASAAAAASQQHLQMQRGWDVLLPLLTSTLVSELDLITQFTERMRGQQLAASAATSPPPLFSGPRVLLKSETRRLRCRCRMVVLLQRTLCEYTSRRCGQMPWAITRQLVALLVGVAQRLMSFNMREDIPPEVLAAQEQQLLLQHPKHQRPTDALEPAAAAAGPSADAQGKATTAVEGWGDGWDDGWEEEGGSAIEAGEAEGAAGSTSADTAALIKEDDAPRSSGVGHAAAELSPPGEGGDEKPPVECQPLRASEAAVTTVAGEGTAPGTEASSARDEEPAGTGTVSATADADATAPAAVSAPVPALPGARLQLSGPHLQLTSATSHDGMRPALARLEVEAADAAISLLLACVALAPAGTSDPVHGTADVDAVRRREACAQLDSLCRQIIECNVAAHATASGAATVAPRHAASPSAPREPAALDPSLPGSSWDHAVRAAVLAKAIHVVMMLGTMEDEVGLVPPAAGAGSKAAAARQLVLLPDVLALLGSHQAIVRRAVADFVEAVVGPRLQQVLAAQ